MKYVCSSLANHEAVIGEICKPDFDGASFKLYHYQQFGYSVAMTITRQSVADKIAAYLHREISVAQLVDWAEQAMMDGEFVEADAETLSAVVARLGVADTRAFGLAWEDCEDLLRQLGFTARVDVMSV